MAKQIKTVLFIAIAALLLSGCSTKKNTLTRRAFHNLTSHYNVFWNGEYSLMEGDMQLKKNAKDDYSKVLPVFNYGTKTEAMGLNSQMDRALQKTSICVQKHSMKFNGKERVRWIDDAYLVMGKAHFYKQDYIPARRTFDFVATEFKDNDIALVSDLWLVKTYIKTEQYPKAVAMIEQIQSKIADEKKLPKELQRNFDLTVADYYIATRDYGRAIDYLKAGLLKAKGRDLRTRVMFILGQIYMELDEADRATEQFKKVVKRNPTYEMLFESKMNMAKMGSSGNAKDLYKMLEKMLDDPKNEEFRDRIYYAMAELAMRETDTVKAIGYYRESVANASNNKIQCANSSLKVATILFGRNEYELSQAYYDTAVNAMDKNTTIGYDSILNISQTLNDLVMNLTVIRDQDSLLRVANMDSISRNAFIDKIIAKVIEQERIEAEQRRYEEQMALMGSTVGKTAASKTMESNNAGAGWYFYNETTLRNGYNEFSKKWGMRKLEDNWRITDKRNIGSGITDDGFGDSEDSEEDHKRDSLAATLTNHDRGYYMLDLPLTPEQQEESNKQIADALYNVGFIYLDRLSDYPRSIESYEKLDTRYPGNEKELPSWYALYKMYNDLHDNDNALKYKNRIFDKYPESSYAKVILDPDYYKKLQEESRQASDLYTKTYDAFQDGQYYRVRMNAEKALDLYAADTAFAPRFALLDAIARGRLETVDSMAYALVKVIQKYPTSSIHRYASDLLRSINGEYHLGLDLGDIAMADDTQKEVKPKSPYTYDPNAEHLVIIVFDSKQVRMEPLKVRISDFNKREHRLKSFEVKNLLLDDKNMIISLSIYPNATEAQDYITSMFITDYVFGGIDKSMYSVLPISVANYSTLFKEKKLVDYIAFLKESEYTEYVTTIDPEAIAKENAAAEAKGKEKDAAGDNGNGKKAIEKADGKPLNPGGLQTPGRLKPGNKGSLKGDKNAIKPVEKVNPETKKP
ncbi:MAG: tetratricopeptide repeat protein [Bacteroidales bacterium]|nr:tetratricopeptide repeat protein [Bacteroidales bacterium]